MKRPWLVMVGALGVLALGSTLVAGIPAGATPPHSDQVITVTKTASDTGGPLAGAVFKLYKWAGSCDMSSVVATATTDSSGKATFSLEGHHNYCVVETTPPSGYTLPATATKVVKIEDCTNSKNSDDPANVKVCDTGLGFVDTPIPTPTTTPTTTPTVTTPTTAPPTAAGGGTGTSGGTTPIGGATVVHTGEPWAGSAPYVGAGAGFGAALLGSGALLRRRRRLTA